MPEHPGAKWEKLEVTLDGNRLQEPRVMFVEFKNVGKVELKKDDIDTPLTIHVPNAKIVAAIAESYMAAGLRKSLSVTLTAKRSGSTF